MKNTDLIAMQRLQSSIVADKRFKPDNLSKVLKSELLNVIENYLLVDSNNISVNLKINDFGFIELNVTAIAKRSKVVGILPDENSFI